MLQTSLATILTDSAAVTRAGAGRLVHHQSCVPPGVLVSDSLSLYCGGINSLASDYVLLFITLLLLLLLLYYCVMGGPYMYMHVEVRKQLCEADSLPLPLLMSSGLQGKHRGSLAFRLGSLQVNS